MLSAVSPEKYNIFGIASVTPKVTIGSPFKNVENILESLSDPGIENSRFVVFPELCITGYTCADLFFQRSLIEDAKNALIELCARLKNDHRLIAVGLPLEKEGRLFNCAAVIANGELLGIVPKINIPNYQEFYEGRWFTSGYDYKNEEILIDGKEVPFGTHIVFDYMGTGVGIEICEDLWVPIPPSSYLCRNGAEIILNLSATDDNIGKYEYIQSLVVSQSGKCRCVYAYSSAGKGESSTDLVFSGINLIACDGKLVSESERFVNGPKFTATAADIERLRNDRLKFRTFFQQDSTRCSSVKYRENDLPTPLFPDFYVPRFPFVPGNEKKRNENCREIIEIQSWGLAQRLAATNCKHLTIGISGGLDSTLALLVAHHTFLKSDIDVKGIIGVTMPSVATSSRTLSNAVALMQRLGVSTIEIPIKEAVEQHFKDIGHDKSVYNAVYENSQARERTQILMDLANKYNGMVLGTGDMSELALGWCTYNGDQISMYNVNGGVPKTLVRHLVRWFADMTSDEQLRNVLLDIIDTPISPELIPAEETDKIGQLTEELVGPYELHDFFLYQVLRNGFSPEKIYYLANMAFSEKYDSATIKKWLINFYKRFFSQQFKRSCMPDGPKIGSVCLSPRGEWRMPSDASASLWIKEAENLPTE